MKDIVSNLISNIITKLNVLYRIISGGKFTKGVLWNIISFGVLGISGIIMNMLIGRFYDPQVLGVFNQVYAIYILYSQVAVCGIHVSVGRHIAQLSDNKDECNTIVSAGIYLAMVTSFISSFVLLLCSDFIGTVLKSSQIVLGIRYILPGLIFFALNKVLLSMLNGFRYMKSYAFFQALRYVLIVILLIGCILLNLPGYSIPLILSGAEIILFAILLCSSKSKFRYVLSVREWVVKHIKFGSKAVLGGMIGELNTRVDILVLGYFCNDYTVGIYSFAAMLAEGLYQLLYVFRINLNPIIARSFGDNKSFKVVEMKRKLFKYIYPIALFGGIVLAGAYQFICVELIGVKYLSGTITLYILLCGIVISSGYIVFGNILSQSGYPGRETILTMLTVTVNLLLNIAFIPYWGMQGAAFATSLSFIVNSVILKYMVKQKLAVSI